MSDILTVYFSATGTTAKAAKKLAAAVWSDIYEINPAEKYTLADLNWLNKNSRSSIEMSNRSFRPALADTAADISSHSTILLCFPIWWYVAPTIINSFLESYDFSGKKIILFATSGSSGFGKTLEELKCSVSEDAVMIEGCMLRRHTSAKEMQEIVFG